MVQGSANYEKEDHCSNEGDLEKQFHNSEKIDVELNPIVDDTANETTIQERNTFLDKIQSSNVFIISFGGSMGILNPDPGFSIIVGTGLFIFVGQHLAMKRRLSSNISVKNRLGSIIILHTLVELAVVILAMIKVIRAIANVIGQKW